MATYVTDTTFWNQLNENIIIAAEQRNVEIKRRLCERDIRSAFFALPSRQRALLEKRIKDKKSLSETGKVLGVTKQSVWELEKNTYLTMLEFLFPPHRLSPSQTMPLVNAPCSDFRDVDEVLRGLPPGVIQRLRVNDCDTMDKLCAASPAQLISIKGIGDVALKKIVEAILIYRRCNPEYFIGEEDVD